MKIGSVPYMNAKPLIHGLADEPGVELIFDVPSALAGMLDRDEIAVGMVSSVACFLNPRLEIVPGISISSVGPAWSVKLFRKKELVDVRTLALDTSSLASVLLAKIVLRERYGLAPEFVDLQPDLPAMMDACDAAVVIGDTTMRAPEDRWPALDLGEEWFALTGLPFVFAVWAVNPHLADGGLVEILLRAKERGLESLDEISRSESERLGIPKETCLRYLSEVMDYDLTPDHIEGLTLFREKAIAHGFVASRHELRLFDPAGVR